MTIKKEYSTLIIDKYAIETYLCAGLLRVGNVTKLQLIVKELVFDSLVHSVFTIFRLC